MTGLCLSSDDDLAGGRSRAVLPSVLLKALDAVLKQRALLGDGRPAANMTRRIWE